MLCLVLGHTFSHTRWDYLFNVHNNIRQKNKKTSSVKTSKVVYSMNDHIR